MDHAGGVADVEQDIVDAGIEIVWVLEVTNRMAAGTAETCRDTMDALGSSLGWCVGDGETEPEAGTFNDSPLAQGRGFDIFVPRDSMRLEWSSSHGSPSGNENLSGEDVRDTVLALLED